jgi:hypothetical protein
MDDSDRVEVVGGRVFNARVETRPAGVKPDRDVLAQGLWSAVSTVKTDWSEIPEFMQDIYRSHADLLLKDDKVWGESRGDH